ncbi:MAG: AraC family transcriptional regulator [Lachnospiraceae bacterium]
MDGTEQTRELIFNLDKPLIFNWAGEFKAPSANWLHLTRTLYDYEFMFVTDGTLYIKAGEEEYIISEGSYIIIPPLLVQQGYKPSRCTFYWLHFAQNEGEVMFYGSECADKEYRTCANGQLRTEYLVLPMYGTVPSPGRITVMFRQLLDAEKRYQNKSYDDFYVTSLLLELKSQLMELNQRPVLPETHNRLCNNIKDYINWHICEPVTVAEIASYYGYNARYLSALFKEYTGFTIKDYIINAKIIQAKKLLSGTGSTITQIAYSMGFQDNHNFSKFFKKATGLAPSEYRNK